MGGGVIFMDEVVERRIFRRFFSWPIGKRRCKRNDMGTYAHKDGDLDCLGKSVEKTSISLRVVLPLLRN